MLFPNTLIPARSDLAKKDRYKFSSLSPDNKFLILSNLQKILKEEKPYLNPDLTIKQLAEMLEVNSNQLSQVINELLQKNFHQLINEYRVEEVKQNINDTSRTLLGIALDSGFNSKSSFNRIFKDITGLTPSEYKNSL